MWLGSFVLFCPRNVFVFKSVVVIVGEIRQKSPIPRIKRQVHMLVSTAGLTLHEVTLQYLSLPDLLSCRSSSKAQKILQRDSRFLPSGRWQTTILPYNFRFQNNDMKLDVYTKLWSPPDLHYNNTITTGVYNRMCLLLAFCRCLLVVRKWARQHPGDKRAEGEMLPVWPQWLHRGSRYRRAKNRQCHTHSLSSVTQEHGYTLLWSHCRSIIIFLELVFHWPLIIGCINSMCVC